MDLTRRVSLGVASFLLFGTVFATPAFADEIWVATTHQADLGGLGAARRAATRKTSATWPARASHCCSCVR